MCTPPIKRLVQADVEAVVLEILDFFGVAGGGKHQFLGHTTDIDLARKDMGSRYTQIEIKIV